MKASRVAPTAEHMVETAALLWPAPAEVRLADRRESPGAGQLREFLFVPSASHPRLLLPAATGAAAASALRRYSHALGTGERVARAAGAALVRTGLARRLFPDRLRISLPDGTDISTIETELARLLGQPVVVSLGLGNLRANQKPIMQVLGTDGRSLAFVKVGNNDVTRDLVRTEAASLRQLATRPFGHLRVPEVLHLVTWRELDLLVLSPLHTTARRRARTSQLPHAAFQELATAFGVTHEPLAAAGYRKALDAQIDEIDGSHGDGLRETLDRLAARHGDLVLPFGAWHGDWTPWNMSYERGTVRVWDWERFAIGVPVGFDPLHFRFSEMMNDPETESDAASRLSSDAGSLLAHFGVSPDAATVIASLYLVELAVRFTLAADGPTGQPLRARAKWLREVAIRQPDAPRASRR
jgi:hypothetical protein